MRKQGERRSKRAAEEEGHWRGGVMKMEEGCRQGERRAEVRKRQEGMIRPGRGAADHRERERERGLVPLGGGASTRARQSPRLCLRTRREAGTER